MDNVEGLLNAQRIPKYLSRMFVIHDIIKDNQDISPEELVIKLYSALVNTQLSSKTLDNYIKKWG